MVKNNRVDNLCPHCKYSTLEIGQAPISTPVWTMNRGTAYCDHCKAVVVGVTKVGALELILKDK
jgi:hypothetical protein